jgi:hypothetical protein
MDIISCSRELLRLFFFHKIHLKLHFLSTPSELFKRHRRKRGLKQSAVGEGAELKVPKCENFHRTDFFYFFTIKPLWVGDFRAKLKIQNFDI